jgi:hypothetical protein
MSKWRVAAADRRERVAARDKLAKAGGENPAQLTESKGEQDGL